MTDTANPTSLRTTPLDALHRELGGRMVEFAGYALPVQYPAGIMKEHLHTRAAAGLFDVSHMGQLRLDGAPQEIIAAALESIVPGAVTTLKPGRQRYSMLTTEEGGIIDDLMITNAGDHFYVVVNGATKAGDIAHMRPLLAKHGVTLTELTDRALIALQGPAAVTVMARLAPGTEELAFMSGGAFAIDGVPLWVSRSGYTGEDGYEISIPADKAQAITRRLLAESEVEPAGLGARDSLRLEAGLCLYGHDIDTTTSPIEAGLIWSIAKRRREEGGFPGAAILQKQIAEGTSRQLAGFKVEGRAPVREGATLHSADGTEIGKVTSGGFGPSFDGPVGMGYVASAFAAAGTSLIARQRGKDIPVSIIAMPAVPHGYDKVKKA
ncbi:glycine cleavage system aminomethyltransferase GcvT [Radicibacter daui]|uniref:glycine cleavage system aminomethyltransferase GcvT n=1 Tax=Radicibacter daui TaxID=3064829 RepID=UPI004046908D